MSEVETMSNAQFKAFLKSLLQFVIRAKTIKEISKHIRDIIKDMP
jgi:hypothetical protein